ncbi:hypothetical protein [Mucilaginibacter gilvus]|uniref:Uncharacterized protein n=1 Tax=Mucilaginibacter gilvus TaxID=2305909 RepID=A0A3S3VLG8_9SPHI|nr:hypothetical protein [Mucilaginibacter gilvus]RWY50835.1 hypothetical protein EPL05_12215 [Mucilaginibacter gilvus]
MRSISKTGSFSFDSFYGVATANKYQAACGSHCSALRPSVSLLTAVVGGRNKYFCKYYDGGHFLLAIDILTLP